MNQRKRQTSQAARTARQAAGEMPVRRRPLALWIGVGVLSLAALLVMGHFLLAGPSPSSPPATPAAQVVLPTPDAQARADAADSIYAANRSLPDLPMGRTATPLLKWRLVARYPHDPAAFTQGLLFHNGELYESTGLRGRSTLRRVELKTGRVLQRREMSPGHFGEGLALDGENLIQLTWQAGVGFVYDRATFNKLRRFLYTGEGWGLASDGKRLIMSDGTATLRLLDPATLEQTGAIIVHDGDIPITDLNELENIDGRILANVWRTNAVARIRPEDGQVDGWLDLGELTAMADEAVGQGGHDVLNGIAWDAQGKRLFVTGKFWPELFEIEITGP